MPRYLDSTVADLTAHEMCVTVYCACGHDATLTPAGTFARNPTSTLYRIVDRLRCTKCGRRGDVPEVRVAALSTYGASGWVHPALRTGL